jgi:urea transporter
MGRRDAFRVASWPPGADASETSVVRLVGATVTRMDTAVWVMQWLVAAVMVLTGALKVLRPREKLAEKFKWAATWTDTNVKLLGLAEVLGGIGLVAPWRTGIAPILTPVAASALAVIMAGAVKTHLDLKESFVPPAVLGLLCVVIALARFGVVV